MKLIPLCVLLLASCVTPPQQQPKPDPYARTPKEIFILSDPPGARIEVNGNYIGEAPCIATVEVMPSGGLWGEKMIVASPVIDGQQVQTKWFRHLQESPDRILFDMNLRRSPARLDLRIQDR